MNANHNKTKSAIYYHGNTCGFIYFLCFLSFRLFFTTKYSFITGLIFTGYRFSGEKKII